MRPHLFAVLALSSIAAMLYGDFASQGFYMDDFVVLRECRDAGFGDVVYSALHFAEEPGWLYWRPGLLLLVKLGLALFGLESGWFFGVALAMHLGAVAMVYLAVWFTTRSAALSFAGGLLLLTAPTTQEAVFWLVGAFGVLPPALLLFAAGWCFVVALERRHTKAWLGAYALFLLSLTFREPGYHFPFFVAGAVMVVRVERGLPRRAGIALLHAAPFAVVIAFHFAVLNRAELGERGLIDTLGNVATQAALRLRDLFALTGRVQSDLLVLALAGAILAAAWRVAPARGRILAWWAAVALLPYVAESCAERHAYLLHLCLASGLPIAFGWQAPRRTGVAITLIFLAAANALRLPEAIERHRDAGRLCAEVLAWCERENITRFDNLIPDRLPLPLQNGWGDMLELNLGKHVGVVPVSLWPRPPFLILMQGRLPPADDRTAFLRFEEDRERYTIQSAEEIVAGRVPVPLVTFADTIERAPDRAAAERRASEGTLDPYRTVVLSAPLPPGFEFEPGEDRVFGVHGWPRVEIDVAVERGGLLVLRFPVEVTSVHPGTGRPWATVAVDGVEVRPMVADGVFNALPLEAGEHTITVRVW